MTFDRVERLIGKPNLEKLAQMRVAVVGLGSGGGFVALALAMSGVGNFVLIDNDHLEEANVVRHVADRRLLDMPKAEALAILIRERNPKASTSACNGRIEDNLDLLEGVDLVVCGLDGENAKYVLNQACLDRNLTVVYAGVYERGEGGDCVVIHPYDGPCYACWASELREGVGPARGHEQADFGQGGGLDYGMIGKDGTLEAEPGLWIHVVRIASAQADMALNELLRDTSTYKPLPANTVIMANTALEIIDGQITPPYGALWIDIARDPGCLVCGDSIRRSERLSRNTSDSAAAQPDLTLDALSQDTGLIEDQATPGVQESKRQMQETDSP